jgi:hypothetical protein
MKHVWRVRTAQLGVTRTQHTTASSCTWLSSSTWIYLSHSSLRFFGAGFIYKYVTWDMPASICVGLTLSRCTYMGTQASSCVRIPVFTWGTTAFSCVWLASRPSCLGWPQLPAFTWGTPAFSCLGFSHIHICIYLGYTSIQLC